MFTVSERQELVERYIPLANRLAWEKSKRIPQYIHIDELKSAAYMGLVDAASRCENADNFHPFLRIEGEMNDYLRSISWGKKRNPVSAYAADFTNESDPYYMRFVDTDLPEKNVISRESVNQLIRTLEPLAANMVLMYYIEDNTLKQIGERYDLTIGRVSQIIKKSLCQIRDDWETRQLRAA